VGGPDSLVSGLVSLSVLLRLVWFWVAKNLATNVKWQNACKKLMMFFQPGNDKFYPGQQAGIRAMSLY
jgi:hypothetical protein